MLDYKFIQSQIDGPPHEAPVGIRVIADLFGSKAEEVLHEWGEREDGYEPHCLYLTVREGGASKFVGVRKVWITIHIEGKFLPIVVGEVWIKEEIPPGSIVCLQEAFLRWGDTAEVPENPGWMAKSKWTTDNWTVLWEEIERVVKTEPDYLIVVESDGNSYIPTEG